MTALLTSISVAVWALVGIELGKVFLRRRDRG